MKKTIFLSPSRLLVVGATALLSACSDSAPTAPDVITADLSRCENLKVPAGAALSTRVFAKGVQIYRWNGSAWSFVEPSAVLYADAQGTQALGIHYAGPTWLGANGSKVVGSVIERCTPDASAIPWLLLGAVSADGVGPFQRTTYIQRLNTIGGNAPTVAGTTIGEVASVGYTAEYFFYRAP